MQGSDASRPMAPRKTLFCRPSGVLSLAGIRNSWPASPCRRPKSGTRRALRRLASRR